VIRKSGNATQASAIDRADAPIVVESKELVPGDLVSVKSGDLVPADCIIISSHAFSISQSMLTGEILPVDKAGDPHPDEKHPVDPLSAINVVLSGSSVSAGEAVLLVVTTGKSEFRLRGRVLELTSRYLCGVD
jgi:P-type E1-E2 ATPase